MVDAEFLEDFRDLAGTGVLNAVLLGHSAALGIALVTVEVTEVNRAPFFEGVCGRWEFVFETAVNHLFHVGAICTRHHATHATHD